MVVQFAGEDALDRLGQILVFRELDLPLADIRLIMENPTLDRGILEKQREMLLIKLNRIGHIITNLDQMLKGEQEMDLHWFNEGSQWDIYKSMIEGMDDAQKQSFIDYYGSMEEWEKRMHEGYDIPVLFLSLDLVGGTQLFHRAGVQPHAFLQFSGNDQALSLELRHFRLHVPLTANRQRVGAHNKTAWRQ